MFVLYYFQQDYDGGDCQILATSKEKEPLERKRKEIAAPANAYTQAYEAYKLNAQNGIREFANNNRKALIVDRPFRHPLDTPERTEKINNFDRVKENDKIESLVRQYYCFSGSEYHLAQLYKEINKDLLNEPLPVFIQPEQPKVMMLEKFLFIDEVEEL